MMKNILENSGYVLLFLGVELFIFFGIYVLHALFFKSFPFSESLVRGGYEVFWRFISLQIFIEAALIFVSLKIEFSRELMMFASALLAYSIASVISFSEMSAIWNLMKFPTKEAVGEGFAIAVSVILTLMIFRIIGASGIAGLE